jgi:alkylated DNA repair dioxygenase AlkB
LDKTKHFANFATMNPMHFTKTLLDGQHAIYVSKPVAALRKVGEEFDAIWISHPTIYHNVKIMGKDVPTPRWQQAYGKDYRYTGTENNALAIPDLLAGFLDWGRQNVDPRLHGLLLNWYDGRLGHYIGAHRDDIRDLVPESPILTISLGETRVFRMRPYKGKGFKDFPMQNGQAIVVPADTNQAWTHEVPHSKEHFGRRISVTLRGYL